MRFPEISAMLTAAALLVGACSEPESFDHVGTVVDRAGQPVADATVRAGGTEVQTDADGHYELSTEEPLTWVSVESDDHLGRTRASSHEQPVLVRLTEQPADTVSLHFTGDAMAGRRFYDRNEDGDTADGQLPEDPSVDEHLDLLEDIEPLLSDADLTVVNLETPLTDDPWYDVNGPRPEPFHPTKDFAFSSHPRFADALKAAEVDVVNLGNNHLYDRLEDGVEQTVAELDRVGLVHYGAGATVEEAWAPAIVERKGQSIAFLGCTSITGDEHRIRYVASADQGGAAPCEPQLLEDAVRAAATRADAVVLSIHGGFEYGADPSDRVARLTELGAKAGAQLVVNHHPHVIGGLDTIGPTVVAENMGNFLFDQTIWQTFPSAVFRAELRAGEVVRAFAEPIVLADYRPRGLVGPGAAHAQRILAGLGGPRALMEDGAVELDLRTASESIERTVEAGDEDDLYRIGPGVVATAATGGGARGGTDILRVGSFEDDQVDDGDSHRSFWELQEGRDVGPGHGRDGSAGARIRRDADDEQDSFFNPRHRILLDGGAEVSFVGWLRATEGSEVSAQLSWYPDTKGPSSTQTVERIDLGQPRDDGWVPFRLDATAPADIVAVGPFLRLAPPADGDVELRMDDLALIAWAAPDAPLDARWDHLELGGPASVTVEARHLPGGGPWARRAIDDRVLVPVG